MQLAGRARHSVRAAFIVKRNGAPRELPTYQFTLLANC